MPIRESCPNPERGLVAHRRVQTFHYDGLCDSVALVPWVISCCQPPDPLTAVKSWQHPKFCTVHRSPVLAPKFRRIGVRMTSNQVRAVRECLGDTEVVLEVFADPRGLLSGGKAHR